LTKANNLGPNSPGISTETEKAQLFLNSYDDILHLRWDNAITNLEKLSRKDENYAGGRVKYFLYEAYMARGDLLLSNADFATAFTDYQSAEKYAWGDQGNMLRLFQIEVRIASVLHKLGQDKDAGEFYHNIFDRLNYRTRLTSPDSKDLLNTLNQADSAYRSGNFLDMVRLYETAMKQADKFYTEKTITVKQGDTLPNIAFESGSSIERLRIANQFGEGLVINKDQDILVPLISTNGQ
jgi:tetratricopeptide (TPR) repeat protein